MRSTPLVLRLAAAVLCFATTPAEAQQADRDRAQMLQMQQQMQRLQSDNASLQREQGDLREKAADAERLKEERAKVGKDLERVRAEASAKAKDAERVRGELDALREQTNAQIEQWRKALEERDAALQAAATEKHRLDAEVALLGARLKAQTGRADLCEGKHAIAVRLGTDLIDRYEQDRLRLCEPVTGIWKVGREREIEELRERLFETRLDVPPTPH
jgi:hypothetical protein